MRALSKSPAELNPAETIQRVLRIKRWNQAQLARVAVAGADRRGAISTGGGG